MKSVAFLFLFICSFLPVFSQEDPNKKDKEIIIPVATRDAEQDSVRKLVPYNTLITTRAYQILIEKEKKKKINTQANDPK